MKSITQKEGIVWVFLENIFECFICICSQAMRTIGVFFGESFIGLTVVKEQQK